MQSTIHVSVDTNGKAEGHDVAHPAFNEAHVIHELKHYLPSQSPLKDFIHHNSLHAFQQMKFYDAIFKASKIFGYQATLQLKEFRELYRIGRIKDSILAEVIAKRKGRHEIARWKENLLQKKYDTHNPPRIGQLRESWKKHYHIDLDTLVQPLLFRVLCSYLDQGIAIWKFPLSGGGFLASIRALEKNGFSSFFKTKRARRLALDESLTVTMLLKMVVGDERYFEQYLFDQQFSHHGWSGLVSSIEDNPQSLLDQRPISLREAIIFELLLEIDALELHAGKDWKSISKITSTPPQDLFAEVPATELTEVFTIFQDAFEWSYYDEVLAGIRQTINLPPPAPKQKTFQALFCIDERECSIRRYIEQVDPDCETFGTPGFFGVEFWFQPDHGSFYEKLCPAPVTPKYLIKETKAKEAHPGELLYTKGSHSLLAGTLMTLSLGFWAGIRLFLNLFRPAMSPAISNAFAHVDRHAVLTIENTSPDAVENGLQVGFTIQEMAARVESVLRSIALTRNFAPLVYVIAHGSSSANNPHHGAHDCGACSGRPGSVNARVFASMANHPAVRQILAERGIAIPATTRFVGSLHDTAADQIAFYDLNDLGPNNELHRKNVRMFEDALDLNAKERSRRFASIPTKDSLRVVREEIRKRSVSLFEPRPELGHGTNSLCVIGSRDITRHLFLDRRAFMNSYDCRTDPEGKLLVGVMRPIGLVCGGISLEYYFSRVDNHKIGAGTKVPHNVMGLIGVANSSDGDLRPGLPLQMIEVHDPVRLLVIVEHYPEVVLKTVQATPEMYEWYINDWVHLVAIHPDTKALMYFKDGAFTEYKPLSEKPPLVNDMTTLVESAKEMETNRIADATRENLPVYLLPN